MCGRLTREAYAVGSNLVCGHVCGLKACKVRDVWRFIICDSTMIADPFLVDLPLETLSKEFLDALPVYDPKETP